MNPLYQEQMRVVLEQLRTAGRWRSLELPRGVDFSSNDYLGLSVHAGVRSGVLKRLLEGGPVSSPSSRLLRGHLDVHAAFEERFARFKGTESALYFSSGYMANAAVFGALVGPEDRVLSDAQNHASIIDGIRLSKAYREVYPHLDVGYVERLLQKGHAGGHTFLATESLYSMDGDVAPLKEYTALCERYGALLIVDDSHGVGVYGDARGSGLTEEKGVAERALAVVSTCGKALGASGACVNSSLLVRDMIVNRARSFIFTTAASPLALYAVDAALDVLEQEPWLRGRVLALAARMRAGLKGCNTLHSTGPIVPWVLGNNVEVCRVAQVLQGQGFDVRAVRPPTVAEGTARVRMSVHANHTEQEVDACVAAVNACVNFSIQ